MLPETVYYAQNKYKDVKISEISKTEEGRNWLLHQYMILGKCPTKQAIGRELIKFDDIKFNITYL